MSAHSRDSYVEILRGTKWLAAKVVDTDEHEKEILVNYLENNVEEWVCYVSVSIRKINKPPDVGELKPKEKSPKEKSPPVAGTKQEIPENPVETPKIEISRPDVKKEIPLPIENLYIQSKYKVGDGVLAAWSKSKKFPARVEAVLPNNEYRVQFEDGLKKIVAEDQMTKEADIIPDPSVPKYTTRHKSIDYNALQNAPDDQMPHKKKKKKKDKEKIKIKFNFGSKPKTGYGPGDVKTEIVTQAEVHHDPDFDLDETEGDFMTDEAIIDVTKSFLIHRKDGSTQWSTPIDDPKLPPGWHKHKALHQNNRYQAIIVNSQNKKFFSKQKLVKYLEAHNLHYPQYTFDFACTDNPKKRSSVDYNVEKKVKTVLSSSPSTPLPSPVPSTSIFSDFNLSQSGNFICPNNDCKKEFRKENLLMMHLKHYHQEYKKMLPRELNVAALAYARTNIMDDQEDPNVMLKPVKRNIGTSDHHSMQPHLTRDTSTKSFSPAVLHTKSQHESPLKNREVKAESEHFTTPKQDKIKDIDKIEVADEDVDVDFESQIALFEITKKSDDFKRQSEKTSSVKKDNIYLGKEPVTLKKSDPSTSSPSPVKYEKMKKEEVVNCVCGVIEEDGLMIQCDICLCWQHFHCSGYENESDVPEKYVCKICKNPPHLRKSHKYTYDHDWLHKGILPTLDPDNKHIDEGFLWTQNILKETHDMTGSLCTLSDAMHNASIKMQIVQESNHPKLYLWSQSVKKESKEPDQGPVPEVPIDTHDCRLNLLNQVEQDYDLMEQKLNELEKQIASAESNCSSLMGEPANDKPTLQMLIKDLETLRTLAIVN